MDREKRDNVIAFVSAKAGVGKTFLAANVGVVLAKSGIRASIIDLSGEGNTSMLVGLQKDPFPFSLGELVKFDEVEFERAQSPFMEGRLVLLPTYPPRDEMEMGYLRGVISRLERKGGCVIIDTEGGTFAKNLQDIADRILIIALPNPINLRATKRLIEMVKSQGDAPLEHSTGKPSMKIQVVLNKMERRHRGDIKGIERYLGAPVVSSVVFDMRAINGVGDGGVPFVISNWRSPLAGDIRSLSKLIGIALSGGGSEAEERCFDFVRLKRFLGLKRAHIVKEVKEKSRTLPSTEIKLKVHHQLINDLNMEVLDIETLLGRGAKARQLRQTVEGKVTEILKGEIGREALESEEGRILFSEIMDEVMGLGPLESFLRDQSISEIMVNGANQIFVERNGRLEMSEKEFRDDGQVMQIIERIVSPIGRRIDESNPMVDARLSDGSRVNAIIPPLALKGPTITIRKFSRDPFTIEDLIKFGTLNHAIAEFLRICVIARKNIIISGGTGSGKTTLLNVLSSFIPEDERIITIEDAAELQLRQNHVVSLEARPANIEGRGAITIRDLVRNALRMRPDRIIVGEVRGGEALDMLQAMNTGHDGSITTCHANSATDSLSRLETMVLMAGMELPVRAIRQQIASALELIVQVSRMKDGSRKIVQIYEVLGFEGDSIKLNPIFNFKISGLDQSGKILGTFEPAMNEPTFLKELRDAGIIDPSFRWAGALG